MSLFNEHFESEIDSLQLEIEKLKRENAALKAKLLQLTGDVVRCVDEDGYIRSMHHRDW